jgi:hypothetical protein
LVSEAVKKKGLKKTEVYYCKTEQKMESESFSAIKLQNKK